MTVDNNATITNSLGVPSIALYKVTLNSPDEILEAIKFAKDKNLNIIPLGCGTNILPEKRLDAVVLYIENKNIQVSGDDLIVESGLAWDNVVEFAVLNNLSGIEALSWIPGNAGSAPIQNIGAYGAEIANVIKSVNVYNRDKNTFEILDKEECDFTYRNSIFKQNPNKYIVTGLVISLSRNIPQIPQYKDVLDYFKNRNIEKPSLLEIRNAIIKIRKSKLPDYNQIPNAGSYFTNPIIDNNLLEKILPKYPDIPNYKLDNETYKIPAGWLIEKSGLKGEWVGELKTYDKNALVLTNPNRAEVFKVLESEDLIINKVFDNFGIKLEREPVLLKQ